MFRSGDTLTYYIIWNKIYLGSEIDQDNFLNGKLNRYKHWIVVEKM